MDTLPWAQSLELRTKTIATFILFEAWERMKSMNKGEVLELITEPYEAIESDIRAWCRMTGNELVNLAKTASTGSMCGKSLR